MGGGAGCGMLGGAYFFFLHSLMGKKNFCRGHGPPKPLCGSAPGGGGGGSYTVSQIDGGKKHGQRGDGG